MSTIQCSFTMKNVVALLLLGWLLGVPHVLLAQTERPRPYPVVPPPAFEQAVVNGTRTATGEPGPEYWTNEAHYTIDATLSPDAARLQGRQTVRYVNRAPRSLNYVLVHLRQNLHQAGAVRNRRVEVTGGMTLSSVSADGQQLVEGASGPGYDVDGTVMRIRLPAPLAPDDTVSLGFSWAFSVPERAPRMGRDGHDVFFLGYWYPQVAVYDDVDGWVAEPYQGNGEFYMGYGTYDVSLTLPEGWLVAATGTLQNPGDVLSPQVRRRLQATHTSTVTSIVGPDERDAGASTTDAENGVLTWRFHADRVRDFAFGASNRYVWDATWAAVGDPDGDGQIDSTQIHTLYRPGTPSWERSAEFARYGTAYLSDYLTPYPYPHMTAVEGVIGGGMEYPMLTVIGGRRTDRTLFRVIVHEISHMWFPMIVGQNEKAFTWMDEGPAVFNTAEAEATFFGDDPWAPDRQNYYYIAGSGLEVAPMRPADDYPYGTSARRVASYNKPALALHALRGLVGQDRFHDAYRTYTRRWAFKHPQPYDLFNTFEDVLGTDYDWFWRSLFFETWTLDHAIASVEQTDDGVVVTVEDRGRTPMPVLVRATYEDGRTTSKAIPVDVWLEGNREATVTFEAGDVSRVALDPERFLPDVDRTNNVWTE